MIRLLSPLVGVGLALALLASARADDATKQDKVLHLLDLMEMTEMIEDMRAQLTFEAEQSATEIKRQFRQAAGPEAGSMPPEAWAPIDALLDEYVQFMLPDWTAEEETVWFAELYAADLSEADVDGLIEFYSSPLGQREVRAARNATEAFSARISARQQKRMKVATERFYTALGELTASAGPAAEPQ